MPTQEQTFDVPGAVVLLAADGRHMSYVFETLEAARTAYAGGTTGYDRRVAAGLATLGCDECAPIITVQHCLHLDPPRVEVHEQHRHPKREGAGPDVLAVMSEPPGGSSVS